MKHKDEIQDKQSEQLENIKESGGVVAKGADHTIHCLSIVGQIEGHYILPEGQKSTKYEHLIPLLVSIEQDPEVDGLLILLNTMGGDVEAGLAIAEVIASMTKPTASVVLGGGHSIGVPLAVAAKRSFIVPSATMTIHPVRTSGVTLGVPQAFDYLIKMQDRIINFIVGHSRVDEEKFKQMMTRTDQLVNDIGSILCGREAVECGLIDEIGGIREALEYLKKQN